MAEESCLLVENLSVRYGAIQAVSGVTFSVAQKQIVSLIGANGAGKTSLLKAISGLLPLAGGRVTFLDEDISEMKAEQRVGRGMAHAPEGRGIFLNLTVEENLDLGAWTRGVTTRIQSDLEKMYSLFPRLKERRFQNAGTLSGGEQQMLAIARALMSRPKLLLLDEPSLGLAPQMIEKIFELIVTVRKSGCAVLLVEQNALQALEIADRALVLETGKFVLQGTAEELLKSDQIRQAYLGELSG